jgi:hypothetical protein
MMEEIRNIYGNLVEEMSWMIGKEMRYNIKTEIVKWKSLESGTGSWLVTGCCVSDVESSHSVTVVLILLERYQILNEVCLK